MLRLRNLCLAAAALMAPGLAAAACADDADCCVTSWYSYIAAKETWTNEPSITSNTFWWETVTSVNTNVPYTTLCDRFPRAMAPFQTVESSYLTTATPASWTTSSIYHTGPYPTPPPSCKIGDARCDALFSAYRSSSSAANNDPNLPYPTYPPCNPRCPTTTGGYCRLGGDDATLYYWPVKTKTGNFCAASRTTLAGATTPRSTVLGGTTFVSPTAYLRIGTASGIIKSARYGGTPCGPERTNVLLAFADPAALRTITYKTETASNTNALNLADFNTPAPARLFFTNRLQQPTPVTKCTGTPCTTTLGPAPTDSPRLSVPTELATVDPQWTACSPLPFAAELSVVPLAPEVPNWPKAARQRRMKQLPDDLD